MNKLLDVELGFNSERLVTFGVNLGGSGYDGPRAHAFLNEIHQRLSHLPGVRGVAYVKVDQSAVWPESLQNLVTPTSEKGTPETSKPAASESGTEAK